MPITGYTLRLEPDKSDSALRAFDGLASVEVGEKVAGGWPLVTHTSTLEECKDLADQIRQMPGVASLTLVYHNFEDQSEMAEKEQNEQQS